MIKALTPTGPMQRQLLAELESLCQLHGITVDDLRKPTIHLDSRREKVCRVHMLCEELSPTLYHAEDQAQLLKIGLSTVQNRIYAARRLRT